MDKLTRHIQISKEIIRGIYEDSISQDNKDEYILVMDEQSSNFLLVMNTWQDSTRFYGNLIHIEVKHDGLICVHEDSTDLVVVDYFLEKGVKKKICSLAGTHLM
ncbi:MAG: element excision factor XisI family protein [Bacteroidota bacterium]